MQTNFKTRLTNQPYFLFLLSGMALIIITPFLLGRSADVHLHDTYLVAPVAYFIWASAGIFFLAWFIYKITAKFLWTKALIWIHVSITIIIFILLLTIGSWHDLLLPPIKRDSISYQNIIDDEKREAIIVYPIVTLFLLGQIAYFINLFVGLYKKQRNSTHR